VLAASAVLVAASLTSVPGAGAAHAADTAPSLAWSVPLTYHGDLTAGPGGAVLVNEATHNGDAPVGGDSLLGVSAGGSTTWHVPYSDGDVVPFAPVVDSAGNHYRWQYTSGTSGRGQIIASHGASVLWSKPAPGDPGYLQQLVIGANGKLYDLVENTLYGFDPATGAELFAPLVLRNDSNIPFGQIYAYDKGFVVYSGPTIEYLDFTGNATSAPIPLPAGHSELFQHLPVSATGDVFLASLPFDVGSDCQQDTPFNLTKFTAAGLAWTRPLTGTSTCQGMPLVAPAPDGGVVLDAADGSGGTLVLAISAQGDASWQRHLTFPDGQTGLGALLPRLDTAGQVVIGETYVFGCTMTTDRCYGSRLTRLAGDGTIMDEADLHASALADQQDFRIWESDLEQGLILTPGQAIVSVIKSPSGNIFATPDYLIDALTMPGLGAMYPQALLWGTPSAPVTVHRYVALGDSFSSGEGSPPYDTPTTKDTCHRSKKAYAHLLNTMLTSHLSFVACSGALIQNLYLGQNGEAAQLDALHNDTDLVTLSIGGNDNGFKQIMTGCVTGPGSSDKDCQATGNTIIKYSLQNMQTGYTLCLTGRCVRMPSLADLYQAIHTRAPKARILVHDYPSIFDAAATKSCPVARPWPYTVTASNQRWIGKAAAKLNAVVAAEAAQAQGRGVPVQVVPMSKTFTNHWLCGSKQAWFNGVELVSTGTTKPPAKPKAESFHPNAAGQKAMAAALRTALSN
jgi:lysophospholipase L1-like esterase